MTHVDRDGRRIIQSVINFFNYWFGREGPQNQNQAPEDEDEFFDAEDSSDDVTMPQGPQAQNRSSPLQESGPSQQQTPSSSYSLQAIWNANREVLSELTMQEQIEKLNEWGYPNVDKRQLRSINPKQPAAPQGGGGIVREPEEIRVEVSTTIKNYQGFINVYENDIRQAIMGGGRLGRDRKYWHRHIGGRGQWNLLYLPRSNDELRVYGIVRGHLDKRNPQAANEATRKVERALYTNNWHVGRINRAP